MGISRWTAAGGGPRSTHALQDAGRARLCPMPSPIHTGIHRLADDLVEGRTDPFAAELERWLRLSRRFRAFADAHRLKIRKKLRTAHDPEARSDVRAELLAAYLLLADRRIEVAFEASGSTAGGPDFTVTYRATARFNVEVTRFRGGAASRTQGAPILGKLRQLPPSIANVLLIAKEPDARDPYDVGAVVRALRARSEARDEDLFAAHGLAGSRALQERLRRLSAVILWSERAAASARATLWSNPSARIALPEHAARACVASLRAE